MIIVNVPLDLVVEEVQLLSGVRESLMSLDTSMACAFQRSAQIVGARPLFCFVFLAYFLQELISSARKVSRAISHQRQLRHRIVSLIAAVKGGRLMRLPMPGTLRSVQPLPGTLTA